MKVNNPDATFERNTKVKVSSYYSLMEANEFLLMAYDNRIIASLSRGPMIMAELRRACNAYTGSNWYAMVERLIIDGKVEKQVNGHTMYGLTPEGYKYFKKLRKQAKKLFFS